MRRVFGPWNKCERCWLVALSLVLFFGIGVFWVFFFRAVLLCRVVKFTSSRLLSGW